MCTDEIWSFQLNAPRSETAARSGISRSMAMLSPRKPMSRKTVKRTFP